MQEALERYLISYLLIVATLGSSLLMPLIQLDFEIRRDYIYKTFCVKKEQPIAVCGGTCYLNDRLKETAESQEKEAEISNRVDGTPFFKQDPIPFDLSSHPGSHQAKKASFYALRYTSKYLSSIFRPPQSVYFKIRTLSLNREAEF